MTLSEAGTGECSLPKQQQQGMVGKRISLPLNVSSIKTPFDRMGFREILGRKKNIKSRQASFLPC